MGDMHQLRDEDGNLYGLRINDLGGVRKLLELGTKHEQIARFWMEVRVESHWHGHPLWPIVSSQASNRAKQSRPPSGIFDLMVDQELLPPTKVRRLKIGKHVGNLGGLEQ